jgi:hypothetical protein
MYFIAKFVKTIIKVLNIYMGIQIKMNFKIQIPAITFYFKKKDKAYIIQIYWYLLQIFFELSRVNIAF